MSKKSQKKNSKKNQRIRPIRRSQEFIDNILENGVNISDPKNLQMVVEQENKLSFPLSVLLLKEINNSENLEDYEDALHIIQSAWNISLLRDDIIDYMKKCEYDKYVNTPDFYKYEIFAKNLDKKKELFPNDKRYIARCSVRFEKGHIVVNAQGGLVNDFIKQIESIFDQSQSL
jgi:hypothetical protein